MLSLFFVFFYEHTTQPHKQIFFKREKRSITTQEAAERSETIFHDAQIIIVMSAVQLIGLLATPAVNIRLIDFHPITNVVQYNLWKASFGQK